jgi:hypothetical protein
MGRLIDAAKAATGAGAAAAVAILTADGAVYVGCGAAAAEAAAAAFAACPGGAAPRAAAFAAAEGGATTIPDRECLLVLAGIDPGLPLVCKDRGRWVALPLAGLGETP